MMRCSTIWDSRSNDMLSRAQHQVWNPADPSFQLSTPYHKPKGSSRAGNGAGVPLYSL